MSDICPERGISVEQPRGLEGTQRRAAARRVPADISLRGSARPQGRDPWRGGGKNPRRREPAVGRGGGGWAQARRLVDGTGDAPARRRL